MISIHRRLITILLSLIILIGSITIFLSYKDAHHEVGELFDAQLAQSARVLDALILNQLNKATISRDDLLNIQSIIDHISILDEPGYNGFEKNGRTDEAQEYERKLAFQIWGNGNTLVLRSASAPDSPLSGKSLNKKLLGYFDEEINNKRWRVFSVSTENNKYFMQIGEQVDIRNELTEDISSQLVKTSLLSLPVLAILIWIAISKSLLPLERIANEVKERNKENFKSLKIKNIPIEIEPLINSINDLLQHLEMAFVKERSFTDDAAHELRTPLAALKTQAQVALAADNDFDKSHALEKIIQGVDRASHLVNQMLVIARLKQISSINTSVNIYNFTSDLLEQFENKINEKNITIQFKGSKDRVVQSDPASLTILINNLLDNAIRYSSTSSVITITVQGNPYVELMIENQGESIPAEGLERVFDRFYRVSGTNTTGCGLGLAISKEIAKMKNIKLTLDNNANQSGVIARLIWN